MGAWESREADPVPAIETGENGERRDLVLSLCAVKITVTKEAQGGLIRSCLRRRLDSFRLRLDEIFANRQVGLGLGLVVECSREDFVKTGSNEEAPNSVTRKVF